MFQPTEGVILRSDNTKIDTTATTTETQDGL
jgi:hypothetical protein